jgi:CMP-N-acetylneuraminic acid synthetase/spore coat polysaccharide biosynthesis predicted glycosyltransferase SpsG
VIPARGGSRGVPRKNLRPLIGQPLIAYTIKAALAAVDKHQVIVITDDDEIAEVSTHYGAGVIRESKQASGFATLDELVLHHIPDLISLGAKPEDVLITMQPTCPLISSARVLEAAELFQKGAGSVITVKDDRHLTWGIKNGNPIALYETRVNRQLLPLQFRESGAIIGARIKDILQQKTRIVEPIKLLELPEKESLDIDTFSDLVVAEHWLTRKNILIHADASKHLGMGHVYRALALAQELARHEVLMITSKDLPLGAEFFKAQVFNHAEIDTQSDLIVLANEFKADLVVLDILDTETELVQGLKQAGAKVVSFEDLGPGALLADLAVSDLYPNPKLGSKQLTGVQSAILAPSFEVLKRRAKIDMEVESILVLFGGTDPANLAEKSLEALEQIKFPGRVVCVRGLGANDLSRKFQLDLEIKRDVKNIASLMAEAGLALSSAGRTITELMSVGVPTICLAQNSKELTHQHATQENGILNLGLGELVEKAALGLVITELLADSELRQGMSAQALNATSGRSNSKVVSQIMNRVGL